MKKKFPITIASLSVILSALFAVVISPVTFATTLSLQAGVNAAHGTDTPTELFGTAGVFTTVSNILLFVVGALSVIMIIIGGFRYVISGGNATAVTGAKNTILYAIIGLVVAFLAYAAINWILTSLTSFGSSGTNV